MIHDCFISLNHFMLPANFFVCIFLEMDRCQSSVFFLIYLVTWDALTMSLEHPMIPLWQTVSICLQAFVKKHFFALKGVWSSQS